MMGLRSSCRSGWISCRQRKQKYIFPPSAEALYADRKLLRLMPTASVSWLIPIDFESWTYYRMDTGFINGAHSFLRKLLNGAGQHQGEICPPPPTSRDPHEDGIITQTLHGSISLLHKYERLLKITCNTYNIVNLYSSMLLLKKQIPSNYLVKMQSISYTNKW